MAKKEFKAMEGTEFIYVFEDGDTMPAYIKKVDMEEGKATCWSFSLTTEKGHTFKPLNSDEEAEGACCLLVCKDLTDVNRYLTEIAETGRYVKTITHAFGGFSGCVF